MHQIRTSLAAVITVAMFIPMCFVGTFFECLKLGLALGPVAWMIVDMLSHVEYHANVRELVVTKQEVADLAAHNARVRASYEAAMSKFLVILFFVLPTQAFAATQQNTMNIELDLFPHLTADKEMGIALLSLMILMSFVAFFVTNNYLNKKQAEKLAAMQRLVESEREQTRRFYAVQEWKYRQQRIEGRKEEARQALIQAEQEKQAAISRELAKALEIQYAAEAAKAEEEYKALVAKIEAEQKLKEIQIASFSSAHQLNVKMMKMDFKEFWITFDKKEHQPKFTWDDLVNSCEHFAKTGDASLFFENATIQGIRQFWWVLAQKSLDQITAVQNDSIFWFFSEFISFLERFQSNNSNNKHSLGWKCSWRYSPKHGSSRILTQKEMEALDLIVAKKGWSFLEEWALPINDAATGGLLVAMAKDDTFADEVATIKTEAEFWHSMQMNTEKSLWKAAQWRIYVTRYNKVKALKEGLWAMFATEGVATTKLTADVVVGFNFEGTQHEICDVADTCSIAKILAAGYDQVLRIRRTDAAGIWQESQQINAKYSGNFCTGRGPAQENGYYQGDFKSGKLIPWIADIQINGEWDNFGVILTNSAGVVDYGMGNDNRSAKHQQILYKMFGKGSLQYAPSAGQLMLNKMVNDWFTHRQFNVNHVAAEVKQKLAAAVDNQIW